MLNDMMSRQFYAMNAALSAVIHSFHQLQDATGQPVNLSALEAAQRELHQVEAQFRQIEEEIRRAENAQKDLTKEIKQTDDIAGRLLKTVGGLAAAYLSFSALADAIRATVEISDKFANISARLNLVLDEMPLSKEVTVKGLSDIERFQQMVFGAAQRSYASFEDMAALVARIGLNARDAFGSLEEAVVFSELVQKQFVIAGATTKEAAAATIQLSQALASGVLRGEELNSVFEQAPNIIYSIAKYLGVPLGEIRKLAEEGKLTADIVKNAMFASAEEINKRFENMPLTWSRIWTLFSNEALWAFRPVLQEINNLFNSERFRAFVDSAVNSLYFFANAALIALNVVKSIGTFLFDNWSIIGPLVYSAAGAIITLVTALVSAKIATLAVAAAQWLWNAAVAASPIAWIIATIIVLIGVIYALIGAINKFTGESINATGFIAGAFAALGAFIWNVFIGTLNAIIQFIAASFVEPAIGIIEWMLNVWMGGFNSFGDAVANLIGQIISWFLSLGQVVTKIVDAIFGTNWTAGLESLKRTVIAWGKNENAITLDREIPYIGKRISYRDAWYKGYEWGASLFTGFQRNFDWRTDQQWQNELLGKMNANNLAAKDTADNTKKLADSVDMLEEDLKYLRDLAEREAINRFTTANINIVMNNENHINSELDIDGIIDRLGEKAEETAYMIAEGVR